MKKFILITLVVSCAAIMAIAFSPQAAKAADLSQFRAGLIIDDASFTDNQSMTTADIQAFLVKKNSVCLKDFRSLSLHDDNHDGVVQDSTTEQYGPGTMSAAELIKAAADIYHISPKVILVTLQKEQGLVTRQDCPAWRYNTALGYGCPDTAPCDQSAYGFTRQIDYGTYHFRGFFDDTLPSVPFGTGNHNISYSPDPNCGSSVVNILNRATASLYSYTPYQPNAAALAAGYGEAPCGSYGNRNFYNYFNDWFNPSEAIRTGVVMTTVTAPDTTPARGQTVTYTVSFKNNLSEAVTLDAVGIVGRQGSINGANRDFGWVGPATLQPGTSQQFTFTSLVQDTGALYAWPAINYQGIYVHYNNWGMAMSAHEPNLSLSVPLSSSASSLTAGQTATLSATIKNNEDQPIRIDTVGIPVRYYDRYNYDAAWATPSGNTLSAGATQAVSGAVHFDKAGPYTAWVSWMLNGRYTTISSPIGYNATNATPDFTLTYIETPNPSPALGEDVVVKFKLKNNRGVPMTLDAVGVVGRYDDPYNGPNRDFGWVGPESFAANEEKSYTTFASNVSELKNFYAWVALNYRGTYVHYNNWGFRMVPRIPNLTLSSPLTINSGNPPTFSQPATVTTTVKNNEPRPLRFNAIGIPIRFYNVYNYDATWQGAGTLAASGQSGDSVQLSGTVNFDKHGPYTVWTSINIQGRYITIGNPSTLNL